MDDGAGGGRVHAVVDLSTPKPVNSKRAVQKIKKPKKP